MTLARLAERSDLLRVGRLREERADELDRVRLHGADRLRAAVEERLRHRGLVRALDAAVQPIVRRLERHLHESIWTEPMTRNKTLPVGLKLQCLTIILTDQIAQPRLREPGDQVSAAIARM